MKKVPVILFLVMFCAAAPVAWQIELSGSLQWLDPGYFNQSLDFFRVLYSDALQQEMEKAEAAGTIKDLNVNRQGEFASLSRAFPSRLGLRVIVSRHFSMSLFLSWFYSSAGSNPSLSLSYHSLVYGQKESLAVDFETYRLTAKGFNPGLALSFSFPAGSSSFSLSAGAGYLWAKIKAETVISSRIERDNYWSETELGYEAEGRGGGLTGFVAVRFEFPLKGRLRGFVEAGYFAAKLRDFSGKGSYVESQKDSTGYSDEYGYRWEGDWYVADWTVIFPSGGSYGGRMALNDPASLYAKVEDFELNLSGSRVCAGLAFRF